MDQKSKNYIECKEVVFTLVEKDIKIKNCRFYYGNLYLLIGDNGSGKSLFLSALGKFNNNYKGEINYSDKLLRSSDIIYIPPEGGLIKNLSLKENINLVNKQVSVEEIIKYIDLNKDPRHLSGGEEALINLFKIYKTNKKVYLLDEVTSFLDDEKIDLFLNIIKSTSNSSNVFIIATNDPRLFNYNELIKFKIE